MKFTVNRKAFMKVISPALAVAGRKSEKYKVEKVAKIPSHTLDTCVRDVHEKIMSETSRQYPGKEYGSLTWKKKHSINQQVYMTAEVDFERLRRVTIIVCKEKLTISASNGSIVLKTEIAGDDLDDLAYRCDEEGILTVESSCLKLFLETLEKDDRLIFSSDCSSVVTIQSEQKQGTIRTVEQCSYPLNPATIGRLSFVGSLRPRILADGIRNVMFAVTSKSLKSRIRKVITQVSPDKICFIGSNGELLAVNDIQFKKNLCKKSMVFDLTRDIAESLVKAFSKMQKKEMKIWHTSKPGNPEIVVFEQANTAIYVPVPKLNDQHSVISKLSCNDYMYKANTKAEDWQAIFNFKRSSLSVSKNPATAIKADFVEGYFDVEQGTVAKAITYIPFVYNSGVVYIDMKSIKNEDVSLLLASVHLSAVIKKAKPNDILRIEFGINDTTSKIGEYLGNRVLVRYPIKTNKSEGAIHRLIALLPKATWK